MYENMVKVSVGVMLISDITKQIEIYIGMAWQFSYYLSPPPPRSLSPSSAWGNHLQLSFILSGGMRITHTHTHTHSGSLLLAGSRWKFSNWKEMSPFMCKREGISVNDQMNKFEQVCNGHNSNRLTDSNNWKHKLSATSFVGGNKTTQKNRKFTGKMEIRSIKNQNWFHLNWFKAL